jgi:hypothetical protein
LDRIIKIDTALSELFDNFGEIVRSLDWQEICLLSDHALIKQQNYPGIYRIDVHVSDLQRAGSSLADWIGQFVKEWDHADFLGKNTPTTKRLRIATHAKLLDWMPIYIGKSQKIAHRVAEHINLPLDKRTVAMKLRARPMWNERVFRLSTIHLPVTRYELLAPMVEAELRSHVNPLVGRQ